MKIFFCCLKPWMSISIQCNGLSFSLNTRERIKYWSHVDTCLNRFIIMSKFDSILNQNSSKNVKGDDVYFCLHSRLVAGWSSGDIAYTIFPLHLATVGHFHLQACYHVRVHTHMRVHTHTHALKAKQTASSEKIHTPIFAFLLKTNCFERTSATGQ